MFLLLLLVSLALVGQSSASAHFLDLLLPHRPVPLSSISLFNSSSTIQNNFSEKKEVLVRREMDGRWVARGSMTTIERMRGELGEGIVSEERVKEVVGRFNALCADCSACGVRKNKILKFIIRII
jgi:hypothetical protein